MTYKNIEADHEGQHKAEKSKGRNPQHLRVHVCRADDTGTDQKSHDPQAHDDISDKPPHQMGHLPGSVEFDTHLGLPLEVFLQHALDQGRNLHGLIGGSV